MADFGTSTQQAVFDALEGHAPLVALVEGVYDNHPQPADSGAAANFPYVTIGEDVLTEWDTDTTLGATATITIHTWSRYQGRKETKEIQGAIYDALHHVDLTLTGYSFVNCEWVQSETLLESDGQTRHGIQTFVILIDQ